MPTSARRRSIIATQIALVAVATAGCASVAPVPIEPIETQTEELFGQVQYELELDDIVLLNPYLDSESPRVDEFEAMRQELVDAAEALIDYSVDVIDLARLEQEEAAVAAYVPVLRRFHERLDELPSVRGRLAVTDIDAIAAAAATEPDLTRALGVAMPVHESAADAVRALIAETGDSFDLAFDETYAKIVDEHGAFMAYVDELVAARNETLSGLLMLEAARDGDAEAWTSLRSGAAPGADDMDGAEALLVEELRRQAEIWGYLEPSWTNYQATLRELNVAAADVRKMLRISSFVIESWDRAQRQLSTGRQAGFVAVTKDLAYLALKRAVR